MSWEEMERLQRKKERPAYYSSPRWLRTVIRSDGKVYKSMADVIRDGFIDACVYRVARGETALHKGYGWQLGPLAKREIFIGGH